MTHIIPTRRFILAGLIAIPIAACETLDPAILETLGGFGPLTQAEAGQGIKAALNNGISHAIANVGRENGFFLDDIIKIPLPGILQDVQSILRPIGADGMLVELEKQLNRGAEKAAPVAKDIFVDAITSLTITDAINIVKGPDNAATTYLQDRTSTRLAQLFTPIMGNALQGTGALTLLDGITDQLNAIPLAPQLGADAKQDLIKHGVDYGLKGVFTYIAEEEKAIRDNPAKRTSEILRRVFGYV